MAIDKSEFVRCSELTKENTDDDLEGIQALCAEAERFIASFKWCKSVLRTYFCFGFRYAGVFFIEIEPLGEADSEMWVIVGDIPPAYIDTSTPTADEALEDYCWWMHEWIGAVREGKPVDEMMPVLTRETYLEIAPSLELADMLEGRVRFIEENLLEEEPESS
ncbi:MAG TPA: hypothetical protein VG944_11425 [Fimbriimonas sp.]|nr:hypothetical protein [Fimbriimonas sp.]